MDFKQKRYPYFSSVPWYVDASIGCISVFLTETLLFPLESAKIRLQAKGAWKSSTDRSFINSIKQTIKAAGISGIYKGLSFTIAREFAFILPKLYSYEQVKRYFAADIEKVGYYRQVCPVIVSSFFGILACNALDVMRINHIKDIGTPLQNSAKNIAKSIYQYENGVGLKRGLFVNFVRSSIFMSAELAALIQTKLLLMKKTNGNKDSLQLQFISCTSGSLAACLAICPIDVIRTRYMMKSGEQFAFKTLTECILDLIRNQGLATFYRGFVPLVLKSVPSSLILFTLSSNLRREYVKYISV